jgi:hypothetical protein
MDADISITNTLDLPDTDDYFGFKVWAVVPTNSPTGVEISNLRPGDQVIVNQDRNLNGMGAFTKSKMSKVPGIIGLANALLVDGKRLLYPDDVSARRFSDPWATAFAQIKQAAQQNPIQHKRRNAFGKDPGDGKYKLDEGGIILCMPEADGPIYSNKATRPGDGSRDNGREPKYWPAQVRELNSGFLYRTKPSVITAAATRPGGLTVIAFDQDNAFDDNNGAYALEIDILRTTRSPPGMTQWQIFDRLSDAPPTSGIGNLGLNG